MKFVIFAVLISLVSCQDRFIANVVDIDENREELVKFRCFGTIITPKHVLTTANCATVQATQTLALIFYAEHSSRKYFESYTVEKTIIHPSYNAANNFVNNLAVLELSSAHNYNSTFFGTQAYDGKMATNTSCNLFRWSGSLNNNQRDAVTVLGSNFCGVAGNQTFCSTFPTVDHPGCQAEQGSPLFCGSSNSVSGIIITERTGCETREGDSQLWTYYQSLESYEEWIREVSGASLTGKFSIFLIVSAILMKLVF